MKQNPKRVRRCLSVLLLIAICPSLAWAAATKDAGHPQLSAQEQFIDCAQCHEEATPELHAQWYGSGHGLAMVKCYQCHGTFETFRLTPTPQDCAVCHANMMNKCPQNKPCWACHVPHSFKAEKDNGPTKTQ